MTDAVFKQLIANGRHAWGRLKGEQARHDWLIVGEAFVAVRQEAFRQSCTNHIQHPVYRAAFGALLDRHAWMKDIDKNTRKDLFWVVEHREVVDAAHAALDPRQRLRAYHPTTMRKHAEAFERSHLDPMTDEIAAQIKAERREQHVREEVEMAAQMLKRAEKMHEMTLGGVTNASRIERMIRELTDLEVTIFAVLRATTDALARRIAEIDAIEAELNDDGSYRIAAPKEEEQK